MTPDSRKDLSRFFARVDELQGHFINRLRKAVEIPSISSYAESRNDVLRMSELLKAEMESLGIEVDLKPLGTEPCTSLELPPIILGQYGRDPQKPTILVYSHYDVQPASLSDGWDQDPWKLEITADGRLCGRGTSDDKGPLLNWLNMIEAFQTLGQDFPANLLFWFEGMEESGSTGLRAALEEEAPKFAADADAVCVTDTIWASSSQPSITQGLRGVLFYVISITGAKQDAHSGMFGGQISEPMTDMVSIMSSLVSSSGNILIPGILDQVSPVTAEEKSSYESLKLSEQDLDCGIGARALHESAVDVLISRWRKPALSLHRIENAMPGAGATTCIPARISGKFSIRTVPNMEASEVDGLVQHHIQNHFDQLGSRNDLEIKCVHQSDWFFENASHWNYQAAINATKTVWNHEPSVACEGGSIPVALDFKQVLKKNVLLLPVGRPTDGAHSINEKLGKINYIDSIKLYGSYLAETARLWKAR
ncbi:peptidase family M20/M25/M40 [Dactylonectria estremocensis]|uniref:Peptidase family M20/M25/M40 n=1 Tax=Dactylonectria estremocensis TaxID=1079267 RepID=A0A9P9FHX3_9HYPO|nr:peptidase family M20/M25/M40 [Dactylonectria estremocensis]